MLIDHYIDVIRRNVVPDKALVEQCRKLYAHHRQALDLIIRYGEVSAFSSAANEFFKAHSDLKVALIRDSAAAFVPASFLNVVPEIDGTNWWGQARPVLFWFRFRPDKVGLILEVGPMISEKYNREALARELLAYFENTTKKNTSKYTRVHSEYRKLTEDEVGDPDEILSRMNTLYESVTSKHLAGVTGILNKFFRRIPLAVSA